MSHRRFVLMRDEDVTGVSGTGVVAEGVHWTEADVVALRWTSAWPTSVVLHDHGIASVIHVHGHSGKTRIVWLDPAEPLPTPEGQTGGERELADAEMDVFDALYDLHDAQERHVEDDEDRRIRDEEKDAARTRMFAAFDRLAAIARSTPTSTNEEK